MLLYVFFFSQPRAPSSTSSRILPETMSTSNKLNKDESNQDKTGQIRTSSRVAKINDPVELPTELFALPFRFLPPSSRAISSSVSKNWRECINSNPTLHTEIELLNLQHDPLEFNQIFKRLSLLSQNQLVKVSIDVSCFHEEIMYNRKEDWDSSNVNQLLQMLQQSKNSLKVLFIRLGWNETFGSIYFEKIVDFTDLFILEPCQEFRVLEKVEIEIPSIISFNLGTRSKMVSISSNQLVRASSWPGEAVLALLRRSRSVLGEEATYRNFSLPGASVTIHPGDQALIFDTLLDSRYSLQELNLASLYSLSPNTWEFARSCKQLKSIALELEGTSLQEGVLMEPEEGLTEAVELFVPDDIEGRARVEHFSMNLKGYSFRKGSIGQWLDSALETFKLVDSNLWSDLPQAVSSSDIRSILISSHSSLKYLGLGGIMEVDDLRRSTNLSRAFPNLHSLKLSTVHPWFHEFFQDVETPLLQELSISCGQERRLNDVQCAFVCLHSLVKRYSSDLVNLVFTHGDQPAPDLPSSPPLYFKELESISINHRVYTESELVGSWFSRFIYPKLTVVRAPGKVLERFIESGNSPNLDPY